MSFVFNLVVIGMVLGITYFWATKGALSSLIHAACTLVAGAIAFAVWEPIALLIINNSPAQGFMSLFEGVGWAAGLLVPFALSLAVLRAATDAAIPANLKNSTAIDYAGGALGGLATGVISVGILVIGAGFLRLSTGAFGYQPVGYSEDRATGAGSIVRTAGLWAPVDRLTAMLYGGLSQTTLRTGTPLATYYPELDVTGYALRVSYGDGKSRNAIRPDDFRVTGAWRVAAGQPAPVRELLDFGDGSQPYQPLDGEPISQATLAGYIIDFGAGAKEASGQVVLGNAQVRLLMTPANGSGPSRVAHPVALVSQADGADPNNISRWRFDGNEVFIASVGGSSTTIMGFEFVVPVGYQPRAIYVKNARADVRSLPETAEFATPAARDQLVARGRLLGGSGRAIQEADTSLAETVSTARDDSRSGRGSSSASGVEITSQLGFVLQKTQVRALELDGSNQVVRGRSTFSHEEAGNRSAGIDRSLRVDSFTHPGDTVMVQLDASPERPASLLGRVARSAQAVVPPQLVDANGQVYQAVGFIYKDRELVEVRYDPGDPIRGLNQLPQLSSARSDQELTLLFLVSQGVEIVDYRVGNRVQVEFDPPLQISRGGRR